MLKIYLSIHRFFFIFDLSLLVIHILIKAYELVRLLLLLKGIYKFFFMFLVFYFN